jgi:hypothetical protein
MMRAAYLRTGYEANGVVVRVGRRSEAMDALLAGRTAGFVTAWNPSSRRMPRGWNERMLARLRAIARGSVLGEGWGRGGSWAERHLLVAGDARALRVLARRFRQNAIVIVAPRRKARLVWCAQRLGGTSEMRTVARCVGPRSSVPTQML